MARTSGDKRERGGSREEEEAKERAITEVASRHLVDLLVVGNEFQVMHQEGQRLAMDGGHLVTDVDQRRHDLQLPLLSLLIRQVVERLCSVDE